ncbi:DNA polymerase III subunit gamma/tau [Marinomonas sp. C2222]|uniref:DNA polymerase III subunit gamma/tau n=1 Tax=Marinomonas sargassi TaxID=2984494 RepID=A0ABT2YRX9_9GAMM|nr:DNA polymerase III subunit gamma/tau [Marinomonas sargassi]MCV2402649.1 DNA polymerase III subunit gamma/tau [Marinomonas sargassi]
MSYQVLARKWRPQNFLEMAGQDHVLQALVNALRQQRLHHAYLFTGTRGVGKTTIARIFAKCLNCETNGISPEPCGTCDSCREIVEGRFVDLIEVDAASRTKVEDTRELLENVQYAPTRGRFKVYLIDEVHMLSTHSFNALLKTLEEPPAHVKFLLATTDPQKLPVTILSRCLQFNLKNMSPQRVVDYLQTVLNTEEINFDMPALWQIGQAANGSMRDALSLTDQAIAFGNGTIEESGVTAMLGLVNQSQILGLLESIAAKNAPEVLSKVEALADYQPDFSAICGSLLDSLHRVAIEQQVPGALVDQLGDLGRIKNIASTVSPEEIQVMYQSLLIGRRDLHLAHSVRAGFEMLVLRLIAFRPVAPMTVNHDVSAMPTSAPVSSAPASSAPINNDPVNNEPVNNEPASAYPEEAPQAEMPPAEVLEESTSSSVEETEKKTLNDASANSVLEETIKSISNRAVAEPEEESQKALEEPKADIQEAPLSAADIPPWEDQPDTVDDVQDSTPSVIESSAQPEPKADFEPEAELEPEVAPKTAPREMAESHVSTNITKADISFQASDDAFEEEDEDEAEERAINEVSDPFNPAANLVEALGEITPVEELPEESLDTQVLAGQSLAPIPDTIAQPALGLPLPELAHYKELTMQVWWLVAPRLPLTGLVQNILMNSSLVDASEQGIRLEVPLEYGHMLNQVRYEQIQEALSGFFELSVPLIIDTVEDTSGVTAEEFAASKRAEALQIAIEHLNSHPIVKALSSTMGAQLVYDTVKVKA